MSLSLPLIFPQKNGRCPTPPASATASGLHALLEAAGPGSDALGAAAASARVAELGGGLETWNGGENPGDSVSQLQK